MWSPHPYVGGRRQPLLGFRPSALADPSCKHRSDLRRKAAGPPSPVGCLCGAAHALRSRGGRSRSGPFVRIPGVDSGETRVSASARRARTRRPSMRSRSCWSLNARCAFTRRRLPGGYRCSPWTPSRVRRRRVCADSSVGDRGRRDHPMGRTSSVICSAGSHTRVTVPIGRPWAVPDCRDPGHQPLDWMARWPRKCLTRRSRGGVSRRPRQPGELAKHFGAFPEVLRHQEPWDTA